MIRANCKIVSNDRHLRNDAQAVCACMCVLDALAKRKYLKGVHSTRDFKEMTADAVKASETKEVVFGSVVIVVLSARPLFIKEDETLGGS